MNKSNQQTTENVASQPFANQQEFLTSQLLQQQLLQQQNQDDEIDLAELWRAIWAGKLVIIIISAVFAISAIIYAKSLPNIYKASALLAPASSEGAGGLGGLAGQFGGLASLAGISLGGGGSDKTALALEIIKSRSFLENFIEKHQLLVPLMATKGWNIQTNELIIDEEIYNLTLKEWLREVEFPKTSQPSLWEAYKELSELLVISQDKVTSMVAIELEYYSPALAQEWLRLLIKDINDYVRKQDQIEAKNSINYLTQKLEETSVANMQTVFYQLIEEQSKNMMLTQIKEEYVLKTIDPPQVPEEKAKPKRALIVALGIILGGILSLLIVLIRYFSNKR